MNGPPHHILNNGPPHHILNNGPPPHMNGPLPPPHMNGPPPPHMNGPPHPILNHHFDQTVPLGSNYKIDYLNTSLTDRMKILEENELINKQVIGRCKQIINSKH